MLNILDKRIILEFDELGKEFATLRKSKNITSQQMAKDLNISRSTISNFENGGIVDIGFKKVLQIADYLGYEIIIKEKSSFPTFEEIVNG